MKNIIPSILLLTFLTCCTSEEKSISIPETTLSKEKMIDVMLDIHISEATMNMTPINRNVSDTPVPGIDVLKKNNISKEQFDESFIFYTQHPVLLNEIYDQVMDSLSKMQAEVLGKS
ncbi:MAG: DUF4296 domain-containing protein [Bacteroidia bacterium]